MRQGGPLAEGEQAWLCRGAASTVSSSCPSAAPLLAAQLSLLALFVLPTAHTRLSAQQRQLSPHCAPSPPPHPALVPLHPQALEIFEGMERQGLPRDAITYSAAISALAKGKQWHAAMLIFDHMQARLGKTCSCSVALGVLCKWGLQECTEQSQHLGCACCPPSCLRPMRSIPCLALAGQQH